MTKAINAKHFNYDYLLTYLAKGFSYNTTSFFYKALHSRIWNDSFHLRTPMPTDSHRPQQSGHCEAWRADACPERSNLEHLAPDELRSAAGHVHRLAMVHAVRGRGPDQAAAGPGERTPQGPTGGHW